MPRLRKALFPDRPARLFNQSAKNEQERSYVEWISQKEGLLLEMQARIRKANIIRGSRPWTDTFSQAKRKQPDTQS